MITAPGRPLKVDYSSEMTDVSTVLLDPVALEEELVAMLGRAIPSPLGFRTDCGVGNNTASPYQRALDMLDLELSDQLTIAGNRCLSQHLARLLMASVLLTFPHNYTEELMAPAPANSPRALRLAVDAIQADPMRMSTVSDLARCATVSVRALEQSFRAHLDTSPMRYLRDTRMSRAHSELSHGDYEMTTATTVAARWGFAHYGRFASEYRVRYSRTSAETLRNRPEPQ